MIYFSKRILTLALAITVATSSAALGQSYGLDLHNTVMPASGGMAGASVSRPQDLTSAIAGNNATLTQFKGTQFTFGGAWAEPTYNISQAIPLPAIGVTPYAGKSETQGSALGNIGVIQDLSALGMPVTVGMGFISNAGLGVDFRKFDESDGSQASLVVLDSIASAGVDLTENLSVGGSVVLGIGIMDGPFVGNSSMQTDHALRGTLGVNYDLGACTTVGAHWQSKKSFNFDNAISFAGGPYLDINLDMPENLSFGVANNSLMDGKLLLAMDVIYKRHSDAEFLRAIWDDQLVYQFGVQYTASERVKLRLGYAYNENPMLDIPGTDLGGVIPPGGLLGVQYIQALFGPISQHRVTGGIGIRDLLPGVDIDLLAGGMFREEQTFGSTTSNIESYWVGFGTTWRFGRGAVECGEWR